MSSRDVSSPSDTLTVDESVKTASSDSKLTAEPEPTRENKQVIPLNLTAELSSEYCYFYPSLFNLFLIDTGSRAPDQLMKCLWLFSPSVCYYLWFNYFIYRFLPFLRVAFKDTDELYERALALFHVNAISAGRADIVLCAIRNRPITREAHKTIILHALLCGRLELASDLCFMYFGFHMKSASDAQLQMLATNQGVPTHWPRLLRVTEALCGYRCTFNNLETRGMVVLCAALNSLFTSPEICSIIERIYPEVSIRRGSSVDTINRNRFLVFLLTNTWIDAFMTRTMENSSTPLTFAGDALWLDLYHRPLLSSVEQVAGSEYGELGKIYKTLLHVRPLQPVSNSHLAAKARNPNARPMELPRRFIVDPVPAQTLNVYGLVIEAILCKASEQVAHGTENKRYPNGEFAPKLPMIRKLDYLKRKGLDSEEWVDLMIHAHRTKHYDDHTLTNLHPSQMRELTKIFSEMELRAAESRLQKVYNNPAIRLVFDPFDPLYNTLSVVVSSSDSKRRLGISDQSPLETNAEEPRKQAKISV